MFKNVIKEPKMDCIFCKIINQEIPAHIEYEDEKIIAFRDVNPQAPVHTLIIPRAHISTLNAVLPEDAALIGHMMHKASEMAKKYGISEGGYRLVMNCNPDAGQTVFHLHVHLLGGRVMHWPPG
jgi:histidine triad (HIT) family protein